MTYEQELLTRAMNHVDDDMIASAHGNHKRLRHMTPWLTAAALLVVLIGIYPRLRAVINTEGPPSGDAPMDEGANIEASEGSHVPGNEDPDAPPTGLNTPVTLGSSTLTMTACDDTYMTFTLVKTDSVSLYAALYDLMGDALASTEPNYQEDGVVIRPYTIRVYVNGSAEPAYELPSAPGTYEITLDYTLIRNGTYPMQEAVGFYAYIGKDGARVTTRFSLSTQSP